MQKRSQEDATQLSRCAIEIGDRYLYINFRMNTPIFNRTTERIWKQFVLLESLSNKIFIVTGFAYPDLVENVTFN